jgi:hypothetical protein
MGVGLGRRFVLELELKNKFPEAGVRASFNIAQLEYSPVILNHLKNTRALVYWTLF